MPDPNKGNFKPGMIRFFYILTGLFTFLVYGSAAILLWLRSTNQLETLYTDQFIGTLLLIILCLVAFVWFILYGLYLSVIKPTYQTFLVVDTVLKTQIAKNDSDQDLLALQEYIHGSVKSLSKGTIGKSVDDATEKYLKKISEMAAQNKQLQASKQELSDAVENLRHKQEQVALEKAKSESILNSIPNGVVASSRDGNIFLANKEMEKIIGMSSDDLFGKFLDQLMPMCGDEEEQTSCDEVPTQKALQGQVAVHEFTFTVPKTKQRITLENTASPIYLDNEIIGAVDIFRDVTKEREVERAQKEFVSLASHQLRTPITSINWNAEMLVSDPELPEMYQETAQEIYRENRRMQRLVNSLLNVSRIDLGTLKFVLTNIQIKDFVDNLIKALQHDIEQKNITVSTRIDDVQEVINDSAHLDVVIGNLLSNAVKYTGDGGTVSLRACEVEPGWVQIEVEDNGYGIPLDQQSQIFGRLFRASNAKEKETDGNGLGLYLVKKLVEAMGGEVWFTSEEGKGTTFFVKIPQKVQVVEDAA